MLQLVSTVVSGFTISGFRTAFFTSIFIALLSFATGLFVADGDNTPWREAQHGIWL